MDLRIEGAEATAEERAAVDALLGSPKSRWDGGTRATERDGRTGVGGLAAAARRDQLLPALHAVQDRVGWVSEGALNYISKRLDVPPAEIWGVVSFYHLLATEPRPKRVVHVCDDLACRLAGSGEICAQLERTHGAEGTPSADGSTTWLRSPCLGQCERAPAALAVAAGKQPSARVLAPLASTDDLVTALIDPKSFPAMEASSDPEKGTGSTQTSVPQAGDPALRLLKRVGVVDPASLEAYRGSGGYAALTRAIDLGPEAVIAEVTAAKLVGSRRSRLPHRPQVGCGATGEGRAPATWSATPTSRNPGPSRTGCCSRRIRSRSSRR